MSKGSLLLLKSRVTVLRSAAEDFAHGERGLYAAYLYFQGLACGRWLMAGKQDRQLIAPQRAAAAGSKATTLFSVQLHSSITP